MTEPFSCQPRLTIVIPTLNRAHCVGRAVASALAQTHSNIEIIVSNNGSTDDTRNVLGQFRDPRLRIIHHAQTIPAEAHGNFLVMAANGALFLGLSDDDYLEPEFAARVIELFDRSNGLSFVYSRCWRHYSDVRVPSLPAPEIESGPQFIRACLAGTREVCWCACVTRTNDLRGIAPIPPDTIFGDMYYWTKLAFKGKVGCVPDLLSHYLFMGDNLSSGIPVLTWARQTKQLVDEMVAATLAHEVPDEPAARRLRADGARYLARSTSNQFVWCAVRGGRKSTLLGELRKAAHYLAGDPTVWPRVLAALVLPPRLQRKLILAAARLRARGAL
jgi:hypothetical protein